MCGIAGIYNFKCQVDQKTLEIFTDSMTHRGPDGSGYELVNSGYLGLGHRRLSILDLSEAGHQPFYYMDRYWLVYNGEVFNFGDIKIELMAKGYKFHSDTDTEVVMAAYDCYGLKCFDLFNGMWAFALWDEKEKKLLLSRDRYGIKPLYYCDKKDGIFAFASETRAFKFLNGFNRTIHSGHYNLTLKNNYALEGLGYTIFNDIYQLLPGHYMEISDNQSTKQKRWYDIQEKAKPSRISPDEEKTVFYDLFRDACKIRLISDVPVATALSGGLDSSSIYSTVYEILQSGNYDRTSKDSQLAVSAVFPGLESDERIYAENAIDFTKGKIKWITTDTSCLGEDIEKETELFDSISNAPITAISAIYKSMKKEGITVSLDGHGVDEMLYGYLYMVYDLWLFAIGRQDKGNAHEMAGILSGLYHPKYQKAQLESMTEQNWQSFSFAKKLKMQVKKMAGIYTSHEKKYLPVDLPSMSDKPYDFSGKPEDERMLYFESFQNSLPALLRNFDRAGMMNSVEIRMPFLDHRLVEYMFSLPKASKIGKGFTKKILRQAMEKRMDERVRCRTFKVGIGSPFQYWADHHLKAWLYEKAGKMPNEEKEQCVSHLDKYYLSGGSGNLEKAWSVINLWLISWTP